MDVKLVVFDLDGTLLDTGRGISKCIATTLARMGFPVPDQETCRSFVGPPLKKRFLELFDADERTADAVMAAFREEYGKGDIFLADRYAGMDGCLAMLHEQLSLAVATYKREDQAAMLLNKYGMDSFFETVCGSDAFATLTKEQIIANADERLGIPPAQSLVVGDSDNDAEAAMRLGMRFIGVTYGYGFKSPHDVAEFPHVACVDSPQGLAEAILPKRKI